MMADAYQRILNWVQGLGKLALFTWEAVRSLLGERLQGRVFLQQLYFIGVRSQTVVLITGAFTGMVLTAQTYYQFHKVKLDTGSLAVVGISMCSELGPVLTGLMVAGRVGAALAAELGTMRVTEQLDALRTLATHPVDYLVVPRVLGTVVAMPLLTTQSIAVGITAGYAVAVGFLGIDPTYSWYNMVRYASVEGVMTGIIKSVIYGGMIGIISCYKGMHCREGAEGVGRAATEAVVYSSITILISNFFLTLALNRILPTP